MNIKSYLKKLLIISFLCLSGCGTKQDINVTTIQPCIQPPTEYITNDEISFLFDSPEHICSNEQLSAFVKVVAKMQKQINVQKNALDCYQVQFDRAKN